MKTASTRYGVLVTSKHKIEDFLISQSKAYSVKERGPIVKLSLGSRFQISGNNNVLEYIDVAPGEASIVTTGLTYIGADIVIIEGVTSTEWKMPGTAFDLEIHGSGNKTTVEADSGVGKHTMLRLIYDFRRSEGAIISYINRDQVHVTLASPRSDLPNLDWTMVRLPLTLREVRKDTASTP